MKFYKFLTFAAIATLSVSFMSCDDDDDDKVIVDEVYIPTKITYGDNVVSSMTYDSQNRLTQVKSYEMSTVASENEDNLDISVDIAYTSAGEVSKFTIKSLNDENAWITTEMSISYKDNFVLINYKDEEDINIQDTAVLNTNKVMTEFVAENDEESYKLSYDSKGNLIKKYDNAENYMEYSYDSRTGASTYDKTPQWLLVFLSDIMPFNKVNNIIKTVEYDSETGYTQITDIVYGFNDEGYPISFIMSAPLPSDETSESTPKFVIEYKKVIKK